MAWQSAVSSVKQCGSAPTALPAPTVQSPGLVLLRHIACAVPLVDTGHTESGLQCLLRVPGRGSVGLVLPLVLPFSGAEAKIHTVPEYSGEQAYSRGGKGC